MNLFLTIKPISLPSGMVVEILLAWCVFNICPISDMSKIETKISYQDKSKVNCKKNYCSTLSASREIVLCRVRQQ